MAAPPPGKRRKRKRKHTGDVDATPSQDGAHTGAALEPWTQEGGQAEPPADRSEEEGSRHQPESG